MHLNLFIESFVSAFRFDSAASASNRTNVVHALILKGSCPEREVCCFRLGGPLDVSWFAKRRGASAGVREQKWTVKGEKSWCVTTGPG